MKNKYDATLILPMYKKDKEFMYALIHNRDEFERIKEVIVIIDENIDDDRFMRLSYIQHYNINFKFYKNTQNHEWRNPAVVINFGIKNATGKYCIIMSPESILFGNGLSNLIMNCSDTEYCLGNVSFVTYDNYNKIDEEKFFLNGKNDSHFGPFYYGSICCTKKNFESVGYYDENFVGWGGEDTEIRIRLSDNGIIRKELQNVKVIHAESNSEYKVRINNKKNFIKVKNNEKYDNFIELNFPNVDTEKIMGELINMKNNGDILDFELKKVCKHYPIVLLAQCYNEKKRASGFIENIGKLVDCMIILDDESTDGTWNLLNGEKIILKIKKKRYSFNDLENRNLLLKTLENVFIKNNIGFEWILWMDFDERITQKNKKIAEFRKIILSENFNSEIIEFPLYHMWSDTEYNSSYPCSDEGVQLKKRAFKHIPKNMPYVIKSENNLHFKLVPYEGKVRTLSLQIKEIGKKNDSLRSKKYQDYKLYDTENIQKYEHFITKNYKLKKYGSSLYADKK